MMCGISVFVDRDGTLNEDRGYIASPAELVVFPGVGESLARLHEVGMPVVLVTNQSGLARGLFTWSALFDIHQTLQDTLQCGGGVLQGIYICPHHPDDHCACRKPKRGLVDQAAVDLHLVPAKSYVVGDKLIDLELARNIRAVGVLVMTGPESLTARYAVESGTVTVGCIVDDFASAVDWILVDASRRNWSEHERSFLT